MGRYQDLTGITFGMLTVLKEVGRDKHGNVLWECECNCSSRNIVVKTANSLKKGKNPSCGCGKIVNLKGMTFGRLTVIRDVGRSKYNKVLWECECSCKSKSLVVVPGSFLTGGHTKSCGCLLKENSGRKRNPNNYDLTQNVGVGYTDKGQEFYFDIEDYSKIKKYRWHISNDGYVRTSEGDNRTLLMHRLILGLNKGYSDEFVDHIDGIGSNNVKTNLRVCTRSQNSMNSIRRTNNTSGCVGVCYVKNDKKWWAYITINRKQIILGRYDSYESAVKVRKVAEEKYFGEFSYDNSRNKKAV